MHGKEAIIEETLDWHPIDYSTVGVALPVPGAPRIVMTRALLDGPNGATHLELRVAQPKPKDKAFVDDAAAKFAESMTKAVAGLRSMVEGKQPAVEDGRADAEAIDGTLPDRAGEIGCGALKPSFPKRCRRHRTMVRWSNRFLTGACSVRRFEGERAASLFVSGKHGYRK